LSPFLFLIFCLILSFYDEIIKQRPYWRQCKNYQQDPYQFDINPADCELLIWSPQAIYQHPEPESQGDNYSDNKYNTKSTNIDQFITSLLNRQQYLPVYNIRPYIFFATWHAKYF